MKSYITPWGEAQTAVDRGHGVIQATTASHGGFFVEASERHRIPVKQTPYSSGGWYEEDFDWIFVAQGIPEAFTPEEISAAKTIADSSYGKNYTNRVIAGI